MRERERQNGKDWIGGDEKEEEEKNNLLVPASNGTKSLRLLCATPNKRAQEQDEFRSAKDSNDPFVYIYACMYRMYACMYRMYACIHLIDSTARSLAKYAQCMTCVLLISVVIFIEFILSWNWKQWLQCLSSLFAGQFKESISMSFTELFLLLLSNLSRTNMHYAALKKQKQNKHCTV